MAKNKKNGTLAIRFSSLGDVALTIPVLYSVAIRYPEEEFVLLTRKNYSPLFIHKPANLSVVTDLKDYRPSRVADLHNVLHSWETDVYFGLQGIPIARMDRGSKEKKALTRKKHKCLQQLPTAIERYQQVFTRLGCDAGLSFQSLFPEKTQHEGLWIGIAPFSRHAGKVYPADKMEEVIRQLSLLPSVQLFLFGGGENEQAQLEQWATRYENIQSVAGRMSFAEELQLMNGLDVLLSMDSANMHLASLVGTTVVSVWGATHPYAGFYGYNQNPENVVQADLPCRPCSVFGNKPCYRGDYACMQMIAPETIVEKIKINLK